MSRGSQKHEREAVRRAERLAPGLRAWVERRGRTNSHCWLCVARGDVTVRSSLASSPSCAEHALNNTMQQIRRSFTEKGVALQPEAQ